MTLAIGAVVVLPLYLPWARRLNGRVGPPPPLAGSPCVRDPRTCHSLPLRTKSARGALDLAFRRQRRGSVRMAHRSALFSWYIANFGTYNATYGSLGAAVGMMMWMWISMIVVLLGAQLNAEIERQTARIRRLGRTSLSAGAALKGRYDWSGEELLMRASRRSIYALGEIRGRSRQRRPCQARITTISLAPYCFRSSPKPAESFSGHSPGCAVTM